MKNGSHIKFKRTYDQKIIDKVEDFAEKSLKDSLDMYSQRNQNVSHFIKRQIKIGKIGEMISQWWLSKIMGFSVTKKVDFEIYNNFEKDFSSDLKISGEKCRDFFEIDKDEINISCKSSYYQFGKDFTEYENGESIPALLPKQYSWTYQLSNNDRKTGKDKGNHDIYMFNIIDEKNKTAEVYAWVNSEIVKRLFIRPFKQSLKENKLVVQQKTCGALKDFPCGIDELFDESYEPKKPI